MLHENRTPDFKEFEKVLRGETPNKSVLFDFFISDGHFREMIENEWIERDDSFDRKTNDLNYLRNIVNGFRYAGYDYATVSVWMFDFMNIESGKEAEKGPEGKKSTGQAHCGVFDDEEGFLNYKWPKIEDCDYSVLENITEYIPEGMKLLLPGPGGVLENLIGLIGYEDFCYMLADEPELVGRIADTIGELIYAHYEEVLKYDSVGAIVVNDDWGFKTSIMVSAEQMREYVIPWHKKFVDLAHKHGRLVLMHSCGNLQDVWEDIIEEIGFDGKHSYEDTILPVEESWKKYGDRIAILGGLDMDFMTRGSPEEVIERSKNMLKLTGNKNYALGTGNSVPSYIPYENYVAMLKTVE